MTAKIAYRQVVDSLSSTLEDMGFSADGQVFRMTSDHGDHLIVELQRSSASSGDCVAFYVNLALVVAPKWSWDKARLGLPEDAGPGAAHGTWRGRLAQSRRGGGWRWKIMDEESATVVLSEIVADLREELPPLIRLMDRDNLRQAAIDRHGVLGPSSFWKIAAWLKAEDGATAELERFLKDLGQHPGSPVYDAVWSHALDLSAHRRSGHDDQSGQTQTRPT
ncbi:DUF4304 domain-containing protein [Catellatospora bangladeshensis]|uniref:DUF4304 domain-containing protein n=1 Tax=Catellatospora bangladeshensis TaxID=310355 RepID=A0A8J3NNM5_9ACTN|nr:DUF4304 domain-containing protein [Catellatospora bangladeshensis]GIF86263.1 hypothetical protein Cba03nite_76120 [Catellatospora bangladeshensis]